MVLLQNTIKSEKKRTSEDPCVSELPSIKQYGFKKLKDIVLHQKPYIEKSLSWFIGVDLSNELEPNNIRRRPAKLKKKNQQKHYQFKPKGIQIVLNKKRPLDSPTPSCSDRNKAHKSTEFSCTFQKTQVIFHEKGKDDSEGKNKRGAKKYEKLFPSLESHSRNCQSNLDWISELVYTSDSDVASISVVNIFRLSHHWM